eukprot:CAMPEP_0202451416 /NCGR_PEP_ID=MMETSP1360-20130828/9861_1 /ASSEMBLY_ACC=CAM_ASM_000848 /TAXON_ID=515479 /ORGANISM="Licmophora paradoxa, Strain CCMP2313" /LENGTH=60 /DNA_ID=CAMNT_0049069989 /DNA_START=27 /DNA_END=205 /DNA_ORIENTATION=+
MALWKWVEKAGVFQAISDQDIDELLQYEPDYSSEEIALEEPTIRGKISTKLGKEDTLMNR